MTLKDLSEALVPWMKASNWSDDDRDNELRFHDVVHAILSRTALLLSRADFKAAMQRAHAAIHGPATPLAKERMAEFARRAGTIAQFIHDTAHDWPGQTNQNRTGSLARPNA